MMLRKTIVVMLLAGSGFVASNAMAANESGWYAGVSLGSVKASLDPVDPTRTVGVTGLSVTDESSSTGYKLFGGYRLGQNFAVEGGYTNLGKTKRTVTGIVGGVADGTVEKSKASGWQFDAVGILPVAKDFSLIAKVGTIYSTVSMDSYGFDGSTGNDKHSEWNLTYGLGLQYELSKAVAARAEWERYDKLGNKNTNLQPGTGEANINLYSVGLSYKF